jgi:integrase
MIDAMQLRGFSIRTHKSYLSAVTDLARYHHRSPDQLGMDDIQAYFMHLTKERRLSGASCRLYLNGIRFLYLQVLHWSQFDVPIQLPKQPQRIPELLTHPEVAAIIAACVNLKHRTLLLCCYGCGLRVSELVAIKVRHLDGERHLLRVEQGKGAKDRQVILPDALLAALRHYWTICRPGLWLFPSGQKAERALSIVTAQKVFQTAKVKAGVVKIGGIHSLRHAYATHQLNAGLPIHQLQRQLGHSNIHSTLRYVHWVPNYREGEMQVDGLVAALESALEVNDDSFT